MSKYGPDTRLHRPAEYIAAFKGKSIARGALFVVYSPRKINHAKIDQVSRLGMVISKRNARLAVSRNAIKRVIREAYRQRRNDLPKKDLVFRLVKPIPNTSLTRLKLLIRSEVDSLFDRIV